MQPEDLKTYSEIGHALWADPAESRRIAVETLAAASLLDLTPDRILEKATSGLLTRAQSAGTASTSYANLAAISHPFFRLFAEERVILIALHQGHWSYARIARLLGENEESIERLAWQARMQLASGLASIGAPQFAVYPTGTGGGMNCPEYDSQRPWTQRFLDEEIPSGRDRIFLQNHLMACRSCSQALARCRDLYYHVDGVISKLGDSTGGEGASVGELKRVFVRTRVLQSPIRPMFQAWMKVLARKDVQWVTLGALILALVWLIKR